MAECWFRNPHSYIRECAELLVPNIVWDRGTILKYQIDPSKHIDLYYPDEVQYRLLVIGHQGAAEIRRGYSMQNPFAVYPVWEYAEDTLSILEEMLENPVGLSESACRDMSTVPDERPVLGQEHRVVITGTPPGNRGDGRKILRHLADLQEEYPDSIIHLHSPTTFRLAFGIGLKSGDIDPRVAAAHGSIMLANGKHVKFEEAVRYSQWTALTGMTVGDLSVPRNRCLFNITSALWAAENWDKNTRFSVRPSHSGGADILPAPVKTYSPGVALSGDKFHCDTCSLNKTCKYYREGGVCSVPDSEPADLIRLFKSRDSDRIIEGLGNLLGIQSKRLDQGLMEESIMGLDPEVTKIAVNLFNQGVKLAKLVNPALAAAGAARVAVQINQGNSQPSANAFMAELLAEFEAQGIPRANVTKEMIFARLAGPIASIEQPVDAESEEEGDIAS